MKKQAAEGYCFIVYCRKQDFNKQRNLILMRSASRNLIQIAKDKLSICYKQQMEINPNTYCCGCACVSASFSNKQLKCWGFFSTIFLLCYQHVCRVILFKIQYLFMFWSYAYKINRSFCNGAFGSFLLYFFFYTLNFQSPYRLSFMIFASTITSILKSKLIENSIKNKQARGLFYSFFFNLAPLVAFYICHLSKVSEGIVYVIIIILGIFPVDGEDHIIFSKMEERLVSTHPHRCDSLYFWSGHMAQALGSLLPIIYVNNNLEQVWYVKEGRSQFIMNIWLLLALLNFTFYTFLHLQLLSLKEIALDQSNDRFNMISLDEKQKRKFKIFAVIDGLSSGLLLPSFILYYLDIKMRFTENSIALLLAAFFILKAKGEELITNHYKYQPIFQYWSLLSNMLIAITPLINNSPLLVSSLLFAFPMWNLGKVDRANARKCLELQNQQNEIYWQKIGSSLGVLASSFFFAVISTKFYFGYPLFLCGLVGVLKIVLTKPLLGLKGKIGNKASLGNYLQMASVQNEVLKQQQATECVQKKSDLPQRRKPRKIFYLSLIIIGCAFFTYFYLYSSSCYFNNACMAYRSTGDKVFPNPALKLYNQSLAHFLHKQNATNVMLINCNQQCQLLYRSKKGEFYQMLTYDNPTPSWLHFPQLPYFQQGLQATNQIQNHLIQYNQIKGFSLMWLNPTLYNKMPLQIDQQLISLANRYGFHYSEIPSLNLRGTQNRILMIFTKTKRTPVSLPSFVVSSPPKNVLAVQLTFKLITHYRYLREYILYHLKMGVDKFFLYDNSREEGDPFYFQEKHRLDWFLQKCANESSHKQYTILQEIIEDFYDHIIYIPWRIGDRHPQGEAHLHYRLFYQNVVKFTSFTDLDEYLFSPSGKYIPDTLEILFEKQVTMILISSRSFSSRICINKQLSIEQYRFLHRQRRFETLKSIGLTRLLVDHAIHDRSVTNGGYMKLGDENPDIFMVHYTIYDKDPYLNAIKQYDYDHSLQPLVAGLKEACRGRCSDSIGFACKDEQYQAIRQQYCPQQ